MPNILIEPSGPLHLMPKDCPKENRITNFSTRLFFFDHFILPNELLDTNFYLGRRPYRDIFVGEHVEFLQQNDLIVPISLHNNKTVAEGCLLAKESIELGKLNPFKESERRPLEKKLAGSDVFISERLAALNANEHPVLTIEFVDGIPVPHKSWSHDSILDFKSKYYSEYRQFWSTISLLAADLEWLQSENPQNDLRSLMQNGLNDYSVYSAETFGKRLVDAVRINLTPSKSLPFLAAFFAPKGLESAEIELPLEYNVVLGTIGLVKIGLDIKHASPPLSQTASGMSFLHRIRNHK